jgi:hypothetical protein
MTDPRLWDTVKATRAGAFARLLASPSCPPPGDMLVAIAAEFRPVAAGRVSYRLDELARPMFDVAGARDPRAASHRLATLLTDELGLRTDDTSIDGLWIDTVLERRAGHPLTLAVVAAEIGRRAGIEVGICSTPTGWYAGIGERERLWLIDPLLDSGPTPAGPVRNHCGHEVGFAALTGLYARQLRDGDAPAAHRAAQLRGQLPVTRHG